MKTKLLLVALLASATMIAQAKAGDFRRAAGRVHTGAVTHRATVRSAPARTGGFSSVRPMPTRRFGGAMNYPGQRHSSFRARSSPATVARHHYTYSHRAAITRSGLFTAASINRGNRFPRLANHRNPSATSVWNQRNTGRQFRSGNNLRNGNNGLRADWRKHVFAQRSANWHRDWNRHSDHWWNGHRCSFINGSWVIFNLGFSPWWPWYYPDDYYYDYGFPNDGYGSSTYGYDYPYSNNYDPGYDNSGDYQGQMYYDQDSYPDQSQGYYDSGVYQTEAYDDPDGYSDESESDYSTIVAAQERLARQGYYRGETDGAMSPAMQKALKRYQSTNGLRQTGDIDSQTLEVMGLRKGASY